jgi:uncharacterized SAM-binding protein YcdF (DUF218 family)
VKRRHAVASCLAVTLFAAGIIVFRGVGRWLVREDRLRQADAIVVLSGSMPYRAEGAAEIYREGYAPEVWITRPVSPREELSAMGIQFIGEEQYSRDVLIREGVSASAVHILPCEVLNTGEEVREISGEMRSERKSTVIIITSAEHTRRVRALWNRLAIADQQAIVRAAAQDSFDRNRWWRNTHDVYAVVRELLGLTNVWTGLRISPVQTLDKRCPSQSR